MTFPIAIVELIIAGALSLTAIAFVWLIALFIKDARDGELW